MAAAHAAAAAYANGAVPDDGAQAPGAEEDDDAVWADAVWARLQADLAAAQAPGAEAV